MQKLGAFREVLRPLHLARTNGLELILPLLDVRYLHLSHLPWATLFHFTLAGGETPRPPVLHPLPRLLQARPRHPPAEALVGIFLRHPKRRDGLSHLLLPTRTLVEHFPSVLVKVAQISTWMILIRSCLKVPRMSGLR